MKLISCVPRHIREEVDDAPPAVRFVMPPAQHAYVKAAGDNAGKQYYQGNIDFSGGVDSNTKIVRQAAEVIKRFENNINYKSGGYDVKKKLWFPHKSLEGGSPTIAYGHKILSGEDFSKGLTDDEAMNLLIKDVEKAMNRVKSRVKNFDSLPATIRIAAINAAFRGDLGPKTMDLLNQNKFAAAAKEYLNHREYKITSNRGVKKRMEWNAKVFAQAA